MSLVNQPLCEKLRSARESRGYSLADVAHYTRIPVARLRHLEEGNFAAFGSMTYARSFLRTYGKFLGVDAESLIQELPQPVLGGPADYRHLTQSFGPWINPHGPPLPPHSTVRRFGSPAFRALILTLIVGTGLAVYATAYVVPGLLRKNGKEAVSRAAAEQSPERILSPGVRTAGSLEIRKDDSATILVDAARPSMPYRPATLERKSPRYSSMQQ